MGRRNEAGLVLLLGGSDPSGGAGVELDLKVHALFGVHAAAVATCRTLQSAAGVRAVAPSDGRAAERQLALLQRDARLRVVQVAMVADAAWIGRIGRWRRRIADAPWIVDPVFAPTVGRRALPAALLDRYRREVVPGATLLTPNAIEAAELLGLAVADVARAPDEAARALLALGCESVLLKGGHLARGATVVDRLRGRFGTRDFVSPRRAGPSPRGTGGALASAIAAGVARGASWGRAIEAARRWLARARAGARPVGAGRPYLALKRP